MKTPRTDWFYRRAAYPLRDSDPTELQAFWRNPDKFPSTKHNGWQCLGPVNFAGRVTALARDANHLYAGTAAGGVWKSSNGGLSWTSVWPANLSQNIGALGLDPARPGYLVCATGEGNLTAATYPGSGIYCSEDGGANWTPWLSDAVTHGFTSDQIPRRIASVAVATRTDGKPIVAFGAVAKDESHPAGLFLQKDTLIYGGGETQQDRFVTRWGIRSYNCHSVVFHPSDPDTLYVAIEPRGTQNGVWRTTDNGLTWEHLNPHGLPAGERCGRISLAISPSHPDHLYALVADCDGRFHGVYHSSDRGDTWQRNARSAVFAGEFDLRSNSVIAVHPEDPNVVILGAAGLYISRDGGLVWKKFTTPDLISGHHALLISGSPENPVIFSGNDAGVAASHDGGHTWRYRSRNLVSAMFYNLSVSPVNSELYGGGAQDIGALLRSGSTGDFARPFKGDGGVLVFDPVDPHVAHGTNASGRVFRHLSGDFKKGWKGSSPQFSKAEKMLRALFPLAIRPAKGERPHQRWVATNRLWFTPDERRPFRPASRRLDNSAISTMAFCPGNQDTILAGTTDGGVFRLEAIEEFWFWSANLAGPLIPARLITQIRFHPTDQNTVVLCVGASSAPVANLSGKDTPFSHVFRSFDRGNTWEDIDAGGLPNVAFNAIAFEADEPHHIFVGGDLGVWVYEEQPEKRWINISGNLPNVIISDLDYHAKEQVLTAATFGRGIWRLPLPKKAAPASTQTPAPTPAPQPTGKSRRKSAPAPVKATPKPAPSATKSAPKRGSKVAKSAPTAVKATPKAALSATKSAPKRGSTAAKSAPAAVKATPKRPTPATKSATKRRSTTAKSAPAAVKTTPKRPTPATKSAPKRGSGPAAVKATPKAALSATKSAPRRGSAAPPAAKRTSKSAPKRAATGGKRTPAARKTAAPPKSAPKPAAPTRRAAPKKSASAGKPATAGSKTRPRNSAPKKPGRRSR